jgi:pimeloyl-ACP methyl ester carboxylesterase
MPAWSIVLMPSSPPEHSRAGFEDEYPFESHFASIDGQRYHYIDEGSGSVVLCVHGNPTWSFAWRRVVRDLSANHRVIAIDHIGCGFSDKPQQYAYTLDQHIANLSEFITQQELRDITLVAHDWGGAIGMGAAGRMPDRFKQFALMNTAAFRSTRIPFRIAVCRIPVLGAVGVRGFNLFARAALKMAVARPLTSSVRAGFIRPYDSWANRIAVHRFVQDIPLRESHPCYQTLVDVENSLAQFTGHPMVLVWGEKDWCFTPEFRDQFLQRFPNAKSVPVPDAGHYVFEDAPETLLSELRELLGPAAE